MVLYPYSSRYPSIFIVIFVFIYKECFLSWGVPSIRSLVSTPILPCSKVWSGYQRIGDERHPFCRENIILSWYCCHAWQVTTTPHVDGPSTDDKTDTRTPSCPPCFLTISPITGATGRKLILAHWSAFLQHGQQTPIFCKPSFGTGQRYPVLFLSDCSKFRLWWQSNALLAGCSKIRLLWQPSYARLAA